MIEGTNTGRVRDENPPPLAPLSWSNWQAAIKGEGAIQTVEMRLYSDARFVGEAYGLGPYSFLNTVPRTRHRTMYELKPGIVLRCDLQLRPYIGALTITDDTHYHGGTLFDEVTALASLLLGVRLKSGLIDREFGNDSDPLGKPRAHDASFEPFLPPLNELPQIPQLKRQCGLKDLDQLSTYPLLTNDAAIALVKAARLYQDALWLADTAPEMSWLLLVSAIETGANHWDGDTKTPVERLAISHGRLVSLLEESGAEALVPQIAKMMKGVIGATNKFLTFMEEFAPDAPVDRPSRGRIDFSSEKLSHALKRIYELRSRALHAGIPFPFPMCRPPGVDEESVPEERPTGLGCGALGATWNVDDTPMLLHTFAYLTRGALLEWWKTLVPEGVEVQFPHFG
ncbi:hypothetical protein JMK10_00315 [Rhodovulum sulfidophilum]|uniref:hypothetical protein n=1 Tax=Rhodovulum sulfidophilum TaxID=35806 RepID=UPI0019210D90|nr:hypothetical protein [Rhodovulum sulfidophilum]MBL3575586.1 hypothetical protein [Rhodovulum sulfidophilum]MCE8431785.1 hypothetical protein [Rhodovulum sulfidophilum]MCF4115305.1 hypothetical protein [Rhodovulum sulfidophilum]